MNATAKCPVCDKPHEIIEPLPDTPSLNVQIIFCPLVPDLIYVNRVTRPLEIRLLIKERIFG